MTFRKVKKKLGMTGGRTREPKLTVSTVKQAIQDKLRQKVIERDGGCILRRYSEAGACGGYTKGGELILQAEHLNGRANSISYAKLNNAVCLCKYHHIFFKQQNSALYWVLVRKHLGEKQWSIVQGYILDKRPHHMVTADWRIALHKLL